MWVCISVICTPLVDRVQAGPVGCWTIGTVGLSLRTSLAERSGGVWVTLTSGQRFRYWHRCGIRAKPPDIHMDLGDQGLDDSRCTATPQQCHASELYGVSPVMVAEPHNTNDLRNTPARFAHLP